MSRFLPVLPARGMLLIEAITARLSVSSAGIGAKWSTDVASDVPEHVEVLTGEKGLTKVLLKHSNGASAEVSKQRPSYRPLCPLLGH